MERFVIYKKLKELTEYLIVFVILTMIIYAVGHTLFSLSILESFGIGVTVALIRILYKLMGRFGKGTE